MPSRATTKPTKREVALRLGRKIYNQRKQVYALRDKILEKQTLSDSQKKTLAGLINSNKAAVRQLADIGWSAKQAIDLYISEETKEGRKQKKRDLLDRKQIRILTAARKGGAGTYALDGGQKHWK